MEKKNKKWIENFKVQVTLIFFCFLLTVGCLVRSIGKEELLEVEEEIQEITKELPKVYFVGDIADMNSKEDVRDIKLKYESKDLHFEAYTKIKIQGTSSLAYEKKNYTINLYEDEAYENKMGVDVGFGSESKYCLKANWIDRTHARNIVTARLTSDIQKKYNLFMDTPNNGVIDGFPIEVYINGEFLGLYTWNIPKDAWMFNMDDENENHIVLSGERWEDGNLFLDLANYAQWDVEVGEKNDVTLNKFNRLVGFAKNSTDELFKEEFSNYLDLDSTINYYIMLEFAELIDNSAKNMLMVTYDGTIWYPSLYDLDTSFGTDCYGNEVLNYTTINDSLVSNLWKKLVRCFPEEIKKRYFALREDILTEENIMNKFWEYENVIPEEVFLKEKARWGENLHGYDLEQIKEFFSVRIPILDVYMNSLNE